MNSERGGPRLRASLADAMRVVDLNWMQLERYLENDDRIVLPLGCTEQHARDGRHESGDRQDQQERQVRVLGGLPAEYPERAAYVAQGTVEIDGRQINAGQMAILSPGMTVPVT